VLQAGIKPVALSLANGFVLIFSQNYSLLLDLDPGWVWTIGGSRAKILKSGTPTLHCACLHGCLNSAVENNVPAYACF